MTASRLFLCSGATVADCDPVAKGRHRVELDAIGRNANVHIHFENAAKIVRHNLLARLVDFLEIASYVFSADCGTLRGEKWTDDHSTEPWNRDFAFVIPVREANFWGTAKITNMLEELLTFLSNDKYSFTFTALERDRADQQAYFEFSDLQDWPFHSPERVIMFSGGLDSLAGAVDTAASGGKAILVSHRSVSTVDSRQKKLFSELNKQFPHQLVHIPVWINKDEKFGREPSQRTRSFLFAALGTLVAHSVQAGGVRFYENGIVSLNLPIADEALRARASRTTHPITLHLLSSLCAAITERSFSVDNPYLFKTKTEVVHSLAENQAAHLIAHTCSCSHPMFQTKTQRHCGGCSQCTDRRFATTAAGLLSYDSGKDYVSDVFLGPRDRPLDRAVAVDYTRHGVELNLRSESELAVMFNAELSRAVRYETKRSETAQRIIAMHKRHGEVVTRVLEQEAAKNAPRLIRRSLDATSLLALAIGQGRLGNRLNATNGATLPVDLRLALENIDQTMKAFLAKFGEGTTVRLKKSKKQTPKKRDVVIFAAILLELKGMPYCHFLQDHGIKPKWPEPSPTTYPRGYQDGEPWRKKVQDEKTRARKRMLGYAHSELAQAINSYLPGEFDRISPSLAQLASRE